MHISIGRPVVVVLGAGDVGSAVALALHREGVAVVLCDEVDPAWPRRGVVQALGVVALVDSRMRKRSASDSLRTAALTTIGLGPGFSAGDNVDVAIETAWGERLGAVINAGPTLPFAGEPHPVGGVGRK